MSTQLPEPLRQAAAWLQARKLAEARALLSRYLREHAESDQAWYLLSLAVTDPARQEDCLQRALRLNPANSAARERLAELQGPPPPAAPEPEAILLPARRQTAPLQPPKPSMLPSPPTAATPLPRQPEKQVPGDSLQDLRSQLAAAGCGHTVASPYRAA